ncbi:hypothetical protein O181_046693 [Austropuccinia psidii MF-1]|uniref:Integrase catalytic domain-containing protein n=1 Tax=Austropuccinia psidii MF-1 TaxID=1389203 RepID=A0A9Q3HIT1_9BASI|nr:hypothetical protein [Austropuccinia psidii MF-1]
MVHKPGKTFTIPDVLSRRPKDSEEEDKDGPEFDEEEDWIKPHPGFGAKNVNSLNFSGIQVPTKQEGFWKRMQEYLSTMKKPQSSKYEELRRIKRSSFNFFLEDGPLKKRNNPYPQFEISSQESQSYILKSLHEDMGHRGGNETYRRIEARFWWEGMKKSVKKWAQSCLAFQKRSRNLQREQGKLTAKSTLFERVRMDAVHIKSGRWNYMVVGRDDFSGCPETVRIVKLTAKKVAEWFASELICRYGSPKEVTVDKGPEFGKELQDEIKKSGSRIRVTTPCYTELQEMVERGHKQLKDALVKMCGENGGKWKKDLPLVTLDDSISTKTLTCFSPYELQFGKLPVLPIDIEKRTFLEVEWHKTSTAEELLEARAKQLEGKEEMRSKAAEKFEKSREDSMKYWDRRMEHQLQSPFNPGDLVLVDNKEIEANGGLLFKNKCNGPYRVIRKINNVSYES